MDDRPNNLNVYLLYAPEDENLKHELEQHLDFLQRQGHIDLWHEGKILAGTHKTEVQREYMSKAHIIMLLISSNFLYSDCFNEFEEDIRAALQRQKKGNARVIPVILRDCLWKMDILKDLKPLPYDGNSIFSKANRDKAFLEIAMEVRAIARDLKQVKDAVVAVAQEVEKQVFGEAAPRTQAFRTAEQPQPPSVEVELDKAQHRISLDNRDEYACELIAKLIYILKYKSFEEGAIEVSKLLHRATLTRRGELRPDFKRNNYGYARERVLLYEYPVRILEKQDSGRKTLGALSNKEHGEEVVYRIAKQREDGGVPALIRVFFPDSGQPPSLSNFSL